MLGNYFSLIKLSNLITYNYTVHNSLGSQENLSYKIASLGRGTFKYNKL